ncbi:MAG TPA: hypothetical protein VE078_16375, partial [Thermoanaerobaculia bacterium]|nr:hypothetical protein [Thermoanaerobaculia bacterium]
MKTQSLILSVLIILCCTVASNAAPPPELGLEESALDLPLEPAPRARKAEMLARRDSLRAAAPAKAPVPKVVDCGKGDSLQKAIENSLDGDVLEVRGLCNENVRIERRRLILQGIDPAVDGIRGVVTDPPAAAALEVWYSGFVRIENLSIRHTAAIG